MLDAGTELGGNAGRNRWIGALLIGLLLLALMLRLGWSFSRSVDPGSLAALPDQLGYLECGRNLLDGQGCWYADERFAGQRIYAGRTIGYPLLVAICGGEMRTIQVAQSILDVSVVFAAFLLARRWLGDRAGLLAAALVAANPMQIYFCSLALTETLYVAMLIWSVWLVSRQRTMVWGVLLAALAIHVRPSGLSMPMLLAAVAAWGTASERPMLAAGKWLLLSAGITLLVLAPWAMRNQALLGRPILLTTNGGITLYDGVHPAATGASDQRFAAELPGLSAMSEVARDDYFKELSQQEIRRDPWRIVMLSLKKAARTWSPIPLSEQFSRGLYVAAGLLYTLPLFLLAGAGLVWSRLSRTTRLLLISPAIAITMMHLLTVGSMRYRLPAEPLLCILAAGFLWRMLPILRMRDAA